GDMDQGIQTPNAAPTEATPPPVPAGPTPSLPVAPTPLSWRLGIAGALALLVAAAYLLGEGLGPRFRAGCGVFVFVGVVALFSANLQAVNWRTIGWGVALQLLLALLVLKVGFVYQAFEAAGGVVRKFIDFTNEGASFVFGNLADARP